jgi:hypothetical protein
MPLSRPAGGAPSRRRGLPVALPSLLLLALGACASAGATYGSGLAPVTVDEPPYYVGMLPPAASRLAYLPIQYQRGATDSPVLEPEGSAGTPMAALLAEMNAYLDSLGVGARLALASPATGAAPDVRFGCVTDPFGECDPEQGGGVIDAGAPRHRLEVGRPSEPWTSWAAAALAAVPADELLVLTVEIGQYLPRQTNLRGSKAVELGTDHRASLRWLTSLETPVSVIQLTGAIVGPGGRARRIGAEGMLARPSSLALSTLGAQRIITDDDVAALRAARREELPGQPLAWRVALRTLVHQLTGRAELATR